MKTTLVILALILGIGCKKMDHGNITEMWYEPPSVTVVLMPQTVSDGNTSHTYLIPYFIHDSEDWCIRVKGVSTEGEEMTGIFYVTEEEYNKYQIGQYVCVEGMCDEDPNNKKEKQ